jgi:hypothetical protein
MARSIIDKWRFEQRGGHGCSNSDYRLRRTTCCNSFAIEDTEIQDLYIDARDLRRSITLTYDPRSEHPPICPFCFAKQWALVEVNDEKHVPEEWRWAMPHPTLSIDQTLAMVDDALQRHASDDPVETIRRLWLLHLREMIGAHGLALSQDQKRDSCLMPVVFQELIYDGSDLSRRQTSLGQLEDIVEIDVVVWSGGYRRSELTDSQYKQYWQFCHHVLDHRKNLNGRQ